MADRVGVARRLALRVPTLLLARRNLARSGTRTVLAVAAVTVGVVAVGGVGLGGEAFTQSQTEAFAGFGGTADVEPATLGETIDESELDRIEQTAPGARALPIQEEPPGIAESTADTQPTNTVLRLGEPSVFYDGELRAGAIPPNWGSTGRQVILGAETANALEVTAGDRIRLSIGAGAAQSYEVVAVLEPQGLFAPLQPDRAVFLPLDDEAGYDRVTVQATDASPDAATLAETIRSQFNDREQTYRVTENEATQEQRERILRLASTFITAIGGVSLLVAVVTVANTMLMTVVEREAEIGVLRAVGYSKRAVLWLLLAESTMIGLVGVAIGVPIAFGMGVVANQLLVGDPFAFTTLGITYVAGGAAAGIAASLIAGIYPAWRAANKRPVEALE